jgi:hypothetical protein
MLGNAIIIFFVFGAYFRAAREYGKNGFAWGGIGLLAYYLPSFAIPAVAVLILGMFHVGDSVAIGSLSIAGLAGIAGSIAAVVVVYNKLMERAIDQQAALDARTSAAAQVSDSGAATS